MIWQVPVLHRTPDGRLHSKMLSDLEFKSSLLNEELIFLPVGHVDWPRSTCEHSRLAMPMSRYLQTFGCRHNQTWNTTMFVSTFWKTIVMRAPDLSFCRCRSTLRQAAFVPTAVATGTRASPVDGRLLKE